MIYAVLILLPIIVLASWKPFLRKWLTPRGIPGIPAYSDPQLFWGDIHRLKTSIEQYGGFSRCFDATAKDLGVISQLRLGFFKTFVTFDTQDM